MAQKKLSRKWKYDKKYRLKEKLLRRKIMKLIKILNIAYKPHDIFGHQKMEEAMEKLNQVTLPRFLNNEYVTACLIQAKYKFKDGNYKTMEEDLKMLSGLIEGYEHEVRDNKNKN